jgi:hypothetical protein
MSNGYPIDWHIDVYSIDYYGFKYRVTTHLKMQIFSLNFRWIAIANE